MDVILFIESLLYFALGLCFVLYEIVKDTFKWILGILHGVMQLSIMLGILLTFKFLDMWYGKTGGAVSKESLERSAASSSPSSNDNSVSKSNASTHSASTFPSTTYSERSSNTDTGIEDNTVQAFFFRRLHAPSSTGSATTYSDSTYSSGQSSTAVEESDDDVL